MKQYIFSTILEEKEYYLSEFFLNIEFREDCKNIDIKISEIINEFRINHRQSYLIVVKENSLIIDKIYFKSFEEMNNTYIRICNLYNESLQGRFDYLETLNEEKLEAFLIN